MAVGFRAIGAETAGSVDPTGTVGLPAGLAAGDLLVWFVNLKSATVAVATPAGWSAPANSNVIGGAGTLGADAGPNRVAVFFRVADGTESAATLNLSAAPDVSHSYVMAYTKAADERWEFPPECAMAADTAGATTSYGTVTANVVLSITSGDWLGQVTGFNGDAGTPGTRTLAAPGVTLGTYVARLNDDVTTTGFDLRTDAGDAPYSSGTTTTATTLARTWTSGNANFSGATVFYRIRAVPISQPAVVTAVATVYPASNLNPWTRFTSGVAPRNGTFAHTIDFGPTTSGSELVFAVFGGVTMIAGSDWNERLSPVSSGELSIFTKTSIGDRIIDLTHNGTNYAVAWGMWEFPAGTLWTAAVGTGTTTSDTFPQLTGLPGTPVFILAGRGRVAGSTTTAGSSLWTAPWYEIIDSYTVGISGSDGPYLAVGYQNGVTAANITPSAASTYSGTWATPDRQHVVIALTPAYPALVLQAAPVGAVVNVPAPTVETPAGGTDAEVIAAVVAAVAATPAPVTAGAAEATPAAVTAVAAIPAGTFATGSTAGPAVVPASASIPAAETSVGVALAPATVDAVTAAPAATIATGAAVTPSPVMAVTAVPVGAVQTEGNATAQPATVAGVTTVAAVAVATGTAVAAATVTATASIPAATITAVVTVSPDAAPATTATPAPTVATGATVSPAPVATVAAIAAPAAATGSAVTPATVAVTTATPAPAVTAVTTASPAAVPATVVVPAAAAGAGAGASPAAVAAVTAISAVAPSSTIQRPTVAAVTTVNKLPPVLTAGRARPVVVAGSVGLDVTATGQVGQTITAHAWTIQSGGGTLTNETTATPTYTAPGSGSGLVTIRDTVTASGGGTSTVDMTVSYHANVVAAENALTGTARATWDLTDPNLGGATTLQGFADGFTADRTETVNFKIAQSDGAGWSANLYRLGYYAGNGARDYGPVTPTAGQVTTSQSQPTPGDVDPTTTLKSADCGNWSVSLTWTPPAWAPSGMYVLRLNRTGGGASHVLFVLRDDARTADLMLMPADSTWQAYNAFGGMAGSFASGNSLYFGTSVDQYDTDCARYISYNRPIINRHAANSAVSYGAVEWSTFFTGEYPMVRFLERNGIDVKYYGCIDAAGDPTGAKLSSVGAAMMVGHNEYWSDGMRAGWEAAKAAGTHIFTCAANEVFWRMVGTAADGSGRPRTYECQKSTIGGRGDTQPEWTGTWRDPDGAGKGGDNPENTFTGTIFIVNGPDLRALVVPFNGGYAGQPLWRNCAAVNALTVGQSWTSPSQIVGFEWDTYGPAGTSSAGAVHLADPHASTKYCSTVTYSISSGLLLIDAGQLYNAAGTATHRVVVHPGGNGAITFATGTINWALGVDDANTYQTGADNTSTTIRQATLNMLCDMGCTAATLMAGMTAPTLVDWFIDRPAVAAVATVPAPGVSAGGGATATPGVVAAVAAVPAPATATGSTLAPATVTAAASIPSATAATGVTAAPVTVAALAAVAVALPAAGSTVPAAPVVAGSAAVAAASVTVSADLTPLAVVAVAAVPAPALAFTAQPGTVTALAAVNAGTAAAGATVTATAVTAVAAVESAVVAVAAALLATVVAATTTVGAVRVTIGVVVPGQQVIVGEPAGQAVTGVPPTANVIGY